MSLFDILEKLETIYQANFIKSHPSCYD